MVIDNGSRVMRWRVLARPPGTGRDAARAELRLRAERTAYVESTGVRTDDILVVDDIAVVLPDQARGRRFPSATASCPWSRAPVTPDAERMLQDWEGQPTLEELLSGRHPCLNCGKPINADDPQIATVSWMLSRGSTVRFTCRDCDYENELTPLKDGAADRIPDLIVPAARVTHMMILGLLLRRSA